MNKGTKIALYVVLALTAVLFTWRFKSNYDRLMAQDVTKAENDLINIKVPDYQKRVMVSRPDYHLGAWGAGMVLSLVGFGLLVAHDVSQYFASKTLTVIYNDDGRAISSPDYEKAEEEWGKNNFLEAIQLMREYLKEHPREQYAALRIAEIYEKDLQNYLAAALEYEEVLKQKLPPERWGWAAIHLCNLYNGKLNKGDKAIALLQRIVAEYGETAAAEKARKRLAQLEEEGILPPGALASSMPTAPPDPGLPPGFTPKKV